MYHFTKIINESPQKIEGIREELSSGVTEARKEQLIEKTEEIESNVKRLPTYKTKAQLVAPVETDTQPVVSRTKNTKIPPVPTRKTSTPLLNQSGRHCRRSGHCRLSGRSRGAGGGSRSRREAAADGSRR